MSSRMTKAKWMRIARAFDAYANGAPMNGITEDGLCSAVYEESGCWMPPESARAKPGNEQGFGPTIDEEYDLYWWPLTRHGAAHRAVFATLMAENCE